MALVVQREIAVDRMRMRGQVEQQQPADAGRRGHAGQADARTERLRGARCRIGAPGQADQQQQDARRGECDDEGVGGAVPRRIEPRRPEVARRGERRRHARGPRRGGPGEQRKTRTDSRRDAASSQSQQHERQRHRARPLPAGRRKQRAHRLVLACIDRRLVRPRQHRCRARKRGHERAAIGRRRNERQRCIGRQRSGREAAVQRGAEQQQCIGARARCRGILRHDRCDRTQRAVERRRAGRRIAAQAVQAHVRIDLRLDDADRVGNRAQIVGAVLLARTQRIQPLLRLRERRSESLARRRERAPQGWRKFACRADRRRSRARPESEAAAAQAIDDGRLRLACKVAAQHRQHWLGQALHHQHAGGVARIAAEAEAGDGLELRQQRRNQRDEQSEFDRARHAADDPVPRRRPARTHALDRRHRGDRDRACHCLDFA